MDFLQYAESFFRIQFRVTSPNPDTDKVTFADDCRSFFFRIQVKLSNTIVEDRWDLPTICDTERKFWTDNVRKSVGTGLLAFDDRFTDVGSVFSTSVINPGINTGLEPQGQVGIILDHTGAGVIEPADTFNNYISGNSIKWFMSRAEATTGTANGTQVEGFFRLSDVCDFFKNYRSVTRGVICEIRLEKSPAYRCLQFPALDDAAAVLGGGSDIEWEVPGMINPDVTQPDPQADGVTWYVPVYRPSPVMLNIMEERLARTIETDVMYERADVYTNDNITNSANTWRIVTTPFKMTKAIIFFRIYDATTAEQKTLSVLHSQTANARMTNVSLNLNGNQIPLVADLQSYFSTSYGQGSGTNISLIEDTTTDANRRLKKAAYPYQQYLQMCKALAAAYPSSNYTGGAGMDYSSFLYNYPLYCFQVSENYGEAEANDRQTSSLILNWRSGTSFPDGNIRCQAVCVLYTLHQVNIVTGSAQESVVRCL